ncbi:hypothetical protein [Methanoculleus chikugoensis]|uniref:hypothetical protein n=1 Tax=Methanoculleus chikugoensis TaxID=118126 RepID=UPI0006CF2BAF|nr:hypothetical protein [Methanoculleus chikugoensis]
MEGANLAGIVTGEPGGSEIDAALHALAERSVRLSERGGYVAPVTFPAVAGHKVFRDEIWGGRDAGDLQGGRPVLPAARALRLPHP